MRRIFLPLVPMLFLLAAGCDGSKTVEVHQLGVVNVNPSNGATGIGLDVDVTVTFSETVRAETVNAASLCLRTVEPAEGEPACGAGAVPAVSSYDPPTFTARLEPADPLDANTLYLIYLERSLSGAESGDLPAVVRSTFRTAP